jgi:protein-tyrosine phosphatase
MELVAINREGTLFVSGEIDDWSEIRSRGIDTVVDMDGDVDPGVPEGPGEVLYVYYPIRDNELPDLRKLEAVGRMVAELVSVKHRVLVHCRMGFNRSNLVIATALTYLGMCGSEALEHLRSCRPGALYNENFAEHVSRLPARRARLDPEGTGG